MIVLLDEQGHLLTVGSRVTRTDGVSGQIVGIYPSDILDAGIVEIEADGDEPKELYPASSIRATWAEHDI